MSRPTIAAVARAAGVSVASVSRVLNGLPATDEMAARVQRAVEELGYVPDARARSLKVGRTFQLTLAVADVGNPVYVTMMRAVEEVVSAAGYRLVVTTTGPDVADEVALVRGMARGYADGLLISPLRVDDDLIKSIRECDVPVVVAGNVPAKAGVDTVRANSPKGMLLAVDHLARRGRRRIAFVNGPVDTVPGTARAKGFADAMKAHALPPFAVVEAADFTFAAGRAAGRHLLDHIAGGGGSGGAAGYHLGRPGEGAQPDDAGSQRLTAAVEEGGPDDPGRRLLDGAVDSRGFGDAGRSVQGDLGESRGSGDGRRGALDGAVDSRGFGDAGRGVLGDLGESRESGDGGRGVLGDAVADAGSGSRSAAQPRTVTDGSAPAGFPDAVIAANDLLAVGVMHELAARGLRVPEDVAVVGMDDSELAEQSFPPLTSVNLGSAERGRRAAELLVARIEDGSRTPRRIVVQPSLSVRRST